MIGYVLLVSFIIIISVFIYSWMKTYIPSENIECPDGTSIFIKEKSCISSNGGYNLTLTLKNTGRFNIGGYFIKATNSPDATIATLDLSQNKIGGVGEPFGNGLLFETGSENIMNPNKEFKSIFYLESQIYSVEIIPTRFQEIENRNRFISCGNAKIKENINCVEEGEEGEECTPAGDPSLSGICGIRECGTVSNGTCEDVNCGDCTGEDVCNSTGQCVPPEQCEDTCESLEYECGDWTICGVNTNCGDCTVLYGEGYVCNSSGRCEQLCGNSEIDSGEECDDGNYNDGDGCSSACLIESGWNCTGEPSYCIVCNNDDVCDSNEDCECSDCEGKINGCEEGEMCEDGACVPITSISSCKSYCGYLGYDGTASYCAQNCGGQCSGTCESGGDQYCNSPTDYCCCVPF